MVNRKLPSPTCCNLHQWFSSLIVTLSQNVWLPLVVSWKAACIERIDFFSGSKFPVVETDHYTCTGKNPCTAYRPSFPLLIVVNAQTFEYKLSIYLFLSAGEPVNRFLPGLVSYAWEEWETTWIGWWGCSHGLIVSGQISLSCPDTETQEE